MFRGKFLANLRKLVLSGKARLPEEWNLMKCLSLLNQLGRAPWNVKLLERYAHAKGVTLYLARYLRGGPIGNRRIVSYANGDVAFQYLDRRNPSNPQTKEMTLSATDFLKQWAQHIPPATMHTVRAYGLYATGNRKKLEQARSLLASSVTTSPETVSEPEEPSEVEQQHRCPMCNASVVVEPLEFAEPVRAWNVHRAKIRVHDRGPPGLQRV